MTNIKDYFKEGILYQAFQSERNLIIWKAIADEAEFLNNQKEEIKSLYSFIQSSAFTNFVLHTAKLFDTPDKRYPTRCILSFLELIRTESNSFPKIIETTGTIRLLQKWQCSIELKQSVESTELSLFPIEFYRYFKAKYKSSEVQDKISEIKELRDKVVAHDEKLEKLPSLELETVEYLLKFALEIISIFGMAYGGTIYSDDGESMLTINAEREASFIKDTINSLKEKSLN